VRHSERGGVAIDLDFLEIGENFHDITLLSHSDRRAVPRGLARRREASWNVAMADAIETALRHL
jgi:hypothetical protein